MTPAEFKISNRHYSTILKQAQDNLPQESGGFLGGKDFLIQAILPVFNQYLFNKTNTYSLTSEDIERAHRFFAKHQLDYYGVYHTHPKGIPYPSKQDILTGHKYHFIVGLQNPEVPIFCAYEIQGLTPVQIPLVVLSDKAFSVLDIHQPTQEQLDTQAAFMPKIAVKRDPKSETDRLNAMLDNIRKEKPSYEKQDPLLGASDFSTLA